MSAVVKSPPRAVGGDLVPVEAAGTAEASMSGWGGVGVGVDTALRFAQSEPSLPVFSQETQQAECSRGGQSVGSVRAINGPRGRVRRIRVARRGLRPGPGASQDDIEGGSDRRVAMGRSEDRVEFVCQLHQLRMVDLSPQVVLDTGSREVRVRRLVLAGDRPRQLGVLVHESDDPAHVDLPNDDHCQSVT